jgi:hypothetical protein
LTAILGAATAYAAIMWTSNLVAVVFTPGLMLYVGVLIFWKLRPLPLIAPALALALGFGLSAAFFVPALLEQKYINQAQWFGAYYNPLQHFVYFHQLFNPGWGFGISQPGPDDVAQGSLSYQLGAVPALLALIGLATAGRLDRGRRRELWFWGVWAGASIVLTLGISTLVWRHVPLIPYAQFPWRYLMLAILPLSILPGALVAGRKSQVAGRKSQVADHRSQVADDATQDTHHAIRDMRYAIRDTRCTPCQWPALILVALLLLGSYPYLKVEMRPPTSEQEPVSYAALMRFQRTSNEMTGVTAWVDPEQIPTWSPLADEWVAGRDVTTRVDYSRVPQNRALAVNAEGMSSAAEEVWYHADGPGQTITFNRFWYPGWNAYLLDGRHGRPVQRLVVERENGPLARVVVPVPAGEGYILLRFEDTPLRAAARWITFGTVGLIGLALAGRLVIPTILRKQITLPLPRAPGRRGRR